MKSPLKIFSTVAAAAVSSVITTQAIAAEPITAEDLANNYYCTLTGSSSEPGNEYQIYDIKDRNTHERVMAFSLTTENSFQTPSLTAFGNSVRGNTKVFIAEDGKDALISKNFIQKAALPDNVSFNFSAAIEKRDTRIENGKEIGMDWVGDCSITIKDGNQTIASGQMPMGADWRFDPEKAKTLGLTP